MKSYESASGKPLERGFNFFGPNPTFCIVSAILRADVDVLTAILAKP